jgi:hypothetical protein
MSNRRDGEIFFSPAIGGDLQTNSVADLARNARRRSFLRALSQ